MPRPGIQLNELLAAEADVSEITDWVNLSLNAKAVMDTLGNFGPTVNVQSREVKGYMMDSNTGESGKAYFTSDDLRQIAAGCIEVADWLDKRAEREAASSS